MFASEHRDLAFVPRWAIIRVIHRQSVAEHSFFVAQYGVEIVEFIDWPGPDAQYAGGVTGEHARYLLVKYLLRHDEAESLEGDITGPVKRLCGYDNSKLAPLLEDRFGPPPVVTPDMVAIRRAADLMDECMYLAGEMGLGNRACRSALDNSLARLSEAVRALPATPYDKDRLLAGMRVAIAREEIGTKNQKGLAGV